MKASKFYPSADRTRHFSDSDSDDDLLANLLATADGDDDPSDTVDAKQSKPDALNGSANDNSLEQPKSNALKELDFNFLDHVSDDIVEKIPTTQSPKKSQSSSVIIQDNADLSDEEDKKYFEQQRYSDYGRDVKQMLKNKEIEKASSSSSLSGENSYRNPSHNISSSPLSRSFKSKVSSPSLSSSFNGLLEKTDKHSLQVDVSPKSTVKRDVYSDPVFGLRIVKPLISSSDLLEKMQGRKTVTVSGIKLHLLNNANTKADWVIAGVILSKSATRTSQKGSQYCIWKISDLSMEMNTVSVFLFSAAYKTCWKLPTGTVVAILNPSVLESKDNKDLATLSVDNAQRIMILGLSKDLGKCKSMKKNGEPCTAPVNLHRCEYCVYHVKQEYGKFSKRSDLQSHGLSKTIGVPSNATRKSESIYQQRHPDAQPFVAILAKRNEALYKKDCELLAQLGGKAKPVEMIKRQPKTEPENKLKSTSVDLSNQQMKKDYERLNKLRGWSASQSLLSPPTQEEKKPEPKLTLSLAPKLGNGMKAGVIDLSEPVSNQLVNRARLTAIEFVKKNGAFKKANPNRIRPSKEVSSEKGQKRRRDEEEGEEIAEKIAKKEKAAKSKFQEMLELKSAHTELIDQREDEETEQYFRKLEAKERMEEKMLTTFKVECKAVHCSVCKYLAFSSSDLCKKLQHPIKVVKALKRFFKCADCGNRTVSLDRIPTETCKRCASSRWVKTAMMDEKRTELAASKLCIRGAEEKFIGAAVSSASLDLLVPDTD